MKRLKELISVGLCQERIVKVDLRGPRNAAQHHLLDAGLRGSGHSDSLAVTPETRGDPENIDLLNRSRSTVVVCGFPHAMTPKSCRRSAQHRQQLTTAECRVL